MKRLILLLIIGTIGWQAYGKYQQGAKQPLIDATPVVERHTNQPPAPQILVDPLGTTIERPIASNNFRCDGRTHCTQMTSCEEATWFLRNCPGTKMDGDHDGIPCEQQWCNQ